MVQVGNFYISKYSVTKKQYDIIYLWAIKHGYDLQIAYGKDNIPAGDVNWFSALKFCNAFSEYVGAEPVYILNGQVFKFGKPNPSEIVRKITAGGYRLPTEKEWTTACCAGANTRFFWGNDIKDAEKYVQRCVGGSEDFGTKPVGEKLPNLYGLYDMSGNVCEWCFNYDENLGAMLKGGSVAIDSDFSTDAVCFVNPDYHCYETGFRLASDMPLADICSVDFKLSSEKVFVRKTVEHKNTDKKVIAKSITQLCNGFEKINPESDYEKILGDFKALIVDNLKNSDLESEIKPDTFLNASKFKDMMPSLMDTDKEVVWYGEQEKVDFFPSGREILCVAAYYYRTGERKYLDRVLDVLEKFFLENRQYYEITDMSKVKTLAWAWSNGFIPCMRAHSFIYCLWCIVAGGGEDRISSELLAKMAISIMTEHFYTMQKDTRKCVPNQYFYVIDGLLLMREIFSPFTVCDKIKNDTSQMIIEWCKEMVYPDGTMLEQSFNYNLNALRDCKNVIGRIDDKNVIRTVADCMEKVCMMFYATMLPTGTMPASGTDGCVYPPDKSERCEFVEKVYPKLLGRYLCINSENTEMLYHHKLCADKAIGSVYFPYSGQAIIRDDLSLDSRYLFFYSPREGKGHAAENINSIQLFAYGKAMLVSAGASSYGLRGHCPKDQTDIIGDIDLYRESSFGSNTVIVDGKSQSRLENGGRPVERIFSNASENKWHNSDAFVYTEGIYSDAYETVNDVSHKRQIVYHKQSGLYFVFDTLKSDNPHIYTQIWGIMPDGIKHDVDGVEWTASGFSEDEIFINDDTIYTKKANSPNIRIYTFGECAFTYERHCAEINKTFGWIAPTIVGRRYPKTDIHISCPGKAGKTVIATVIETMPANESIIKSILKDTSDSSGGFVLKLTSGQDIRVDFNGGFFIQAADSAICEEYEKTKDGIETKINAPKGFEWKVKNNKPYIKYNY